jgi:hypothetical protein
MDLRLAMLKTVSFYLLHNVSTLIQCRKLSCSTVVCKHLDNFLVSTIGKLLVLLVNYAYYATIFYYEKVR